MVSYLPCFLPRCLVCKIDHSFQIKNKYLLEIEFKHILLYLFFTFLKLVYSYTIHDRMYAGLITNPMTPSDLQIPQKSPKHFAKNLTSPIIPIHLSIQARKITSNTRICFCITRFWFETCPIKRGFKLINTWNSLVTGNVKFNHARLYPTLNSRHSKINISTKRPNYFNL